MPPEPNTDPLFNRERVNVWMWFRGEWVIHTKGATRWYASFLGDDEHPVLPIGEQPADAE